MKNSEVISAAVGGTFFAVPYLALSVPILPSLIIGAAAFAAGELVFKKDKVIDIKESNVSLYNVLTKAKKQNSHILDMITKINDADLNENLNEINDTVSKIITAIERKPEKIKNIKNFFDYYLPVTVKLVDRFDEIEDQKITSVESEKFYESTKDTIKEINEVFKKFLNNVYKSDMLDTNVEIKVLNSMLKSDGLGDNELKVEVMKDE